MKENPRTVNRVQQYHQTKVAAKKARADLAEAEKTLKRFRISVNGERELFDEFVVRNKKCTRPVPGQFFINFKNFEVPISFVWRCERREQVFICLSYFPFSPPCSDILTKRLVF
jgi:hypothetical protein